MCLSTVYRKGADENVFLCKNVARVIPEENGVVLYDLMGRKTRVPGRILNIDLLENIILIEGETE
jgi:predicted RNA-binding protein